MPIAKAPLLRQRLIYAIREGRYSGTLPSERDLSAEYSVNFKTVGKVLRALAQDGIVERRPGRGTVVIGRGDVPLRRCLHMLPVAPDAISASCPSRHRFQCLIDTLWREASRRGLSMGLLPETFKDEASPDAHGGIVGKGSYIIVLFEGDGTVETIARLLKNGYRPILLGQDREHFPALKAMPFVAVDAQVEATYEDIVTHLRLRGRRRLGIVNRDAAGHIWKDKFSMLRNILEKQGMEYSPRRAIATPTWAEVHVATRELIHRATDMDGLIVPDNEVGRVALDEWTKIGKRAPEDVSLVAVCGDIDGPSYNNHQMTHVETDVAGMARKVAAIVAENSYKPGTHYFPGRLVIGRTS